MLRKVSPRIWMWSEIHGEARNQPYSWNSYAIHIPSQEVLALVDPLAMSVDEIQEIELIGIPTHIILTCEYHLRESEAFRKRWGCTLLVNEVEIDRYDVPLDGTFQNGQRLWDFIDLIYVPSVYYPETTLLIRENGGILIVGDLLCGGRKDRGIPDGQLGLAFPDYVPDKPLARCSMSKLLDYSYEVMCFGHGTPVWDKPKEKLRRYLANDEIWRNLGEVVYSSKDES